LYGAEIEHFGKEIRNTRKVFKYGTGEWKSTVPIAKTEEVLHGVKDDNNILHTKQSKRKVPKLVTPCLAIAF